MDVTHRGLKRLFITDSSRDPVGRLHLLPLPVTDKLVHWLKDGMRSVPGVEEASELQRCLAQSAHCSPGCSQETTHTRSIVCIPLCWLTTLFGFSQSATVPNVGRIAPRALCDPPTR
ncbi:uncharacterized [Tachysurus ichikawai]